MAADKHVQACPSRWPRAVLSVLASLALLLANATPVAAANESSSATPPQNCVIEDRGSMLHYWLSGTGGTQINWWVTQECTASLPSQYANGEIRRQNGNWWWEWITFDTCPSNTRYNVPEVDCQKVSTTVQEYTCDHEIRNNYFLQAPAGQTWLTCNCTHRYGTITTEHFEYQSQC